MTDIRGFFGEYRWLSNFWYAEFTSNGYTYATSEHYYQAAKTINSDDYHVIRTASSPAKTKTLSRTFECRKDWDKVKENVMRDALYLKFTQNEDLKHKLLATGDAYLEETNHWGDVYWGVCNGKGHNRLGHLLMQLRNQLKLEGLLSDVQGEADIR